MVEHLPLKETVEGSNPPALTMNKVQPANITLAKLITFIFAALSFIVPFLLSQSQIPTGVFVNALLFLAVLFLPASTRLPLIIFPSLATLTRGLIFGSFTPFLLTFIPIIWLGNWLLTVVFDYARAKFGMIPAGIAGAVVKSIVLFVTATVFVNFKIVPKLFLTTMGNIQLVTALVGFVVALGIYTFVSSKRV